MHGLSDHRYHLPLPRHLPLAPSAEVSFPAGYPAGLFYALLQVAAMVGRAPLYAPDPDAGMPGTLPCCYAAAGPSMPACRPSALLIRAAGALLLGLLYPVALILPFRGDLSALYFALMILRLHCVRLNLGHPVATKGKPARLLHGGLPHAAAKVIPAALYTGVYPKGV